MADCCAELRSELAALRAEVSKLRRVDEQSIIDRAVEKAKSLLKPEIASVGVLAAGAVVQAKSSFELGTSASTKAFQALNAAKAAGKVSAVAQGAASVASAEAGAATVAARAAGIVAAGAEAVAVGAAAFAASALGKAVLAIANVAALAGSIAGLFSLYGLLQVVFPRLDAHDVQLDSQQSQIARNSSDIFGIQQKVKVIDSEVKTANELGERALTEAYNANNKIALLTPKVTDVTNRVDRVEPRVGAVENQVQTLTPKVTDVTNRVDRVDPRVESSKSTSDNALNIANTANTIANSVLAKVAAGTPLDISLAPRVTKLEADVQEQEKLNKQGITLIQQLPTILEPMITNSVTKTIETLVPKSIAQASAEIDDRISGVPGATAKALEPQVQRIIDSNKNLNSNVNTTIVQTVQQSQPSESLLKDIQNQVGIATIGIAAITPVVNLIQNNTTPAAIQSGTTTAVCKTAQPGGCMSNLVNNSVGNAANNINNNTGNLLNAGNAFANAGQLALLNNRHLAKVDVKIG